METIVYLIRHAERLSRSIFADYSSSDTDLEKNQKQLISIEGEKNAERLSEEFFLENVQVIYSSHYARTIGTAKYLARKLDIKINVDERFGERVHGELVGIPTELFYYNQYHDFDYSAPKGESLNRVRTRYEQAFNEVVDMNLGQEVAIFTHGVAMLSFLSKYCEVGYNLDDNIVLTYNENVTFTNIWNAPDVIKITLKDKEIVNIERIELNY